MPESTCDQIHFVWYYYCEPSYQNKFDHALYKKYVSYSSVANKDALRHNILDLRREVYGTHNLDRCC